MMSVIKKTGLILLIIGYAATGVNHFWHPAFYLEIMPHYIPIPETMNYLAGGFELLFALLLIFHKSRGLAAWGIILMLTVFLTVHIDMLVRAYSGSLQITPWKLWARLALQPVLIYWAWLYTSRQIKQR